MGEAIAIRQALASSDADKQLFNKELEKAAAAQAEIVEKRGQVRKRLQGLNADGSKTGMAALVATASRKNAATAAAVTAAAAAAAAAPASASARDDKASV